MSKSTVANEMQEFEKYNQMSYPEFLEFIGRVAALKYPDASRLDSKIEKLLKKLLKAAGSTFQPVDLDKNIPSDSDCDDDWVDDIGQ